MFVNASDNSTVFAVGALPIGKNAFINPTFTIDYNANNSLTPPAKATPPKNFVRDRWMNFSTNTWTYDISTPESLSVSNTITIPNAVHTTNGNPPSWPILGQYVENGFYDNSSTYILSWEGDCNACYLDSGGTNQIIDLTANTIANSNRKWATLTSPASGNWFVGFQGPSSATGSVTIANAKLEKQVSYHLTSASSSIAGGPTAFSYPDHDTELLKCQRYYYIAFYDMRMDFTVTATSQYAGICGSYAVPLRVSNPDITYNAPISTGFNTASIVTAGNNEFGYLLWCQPNSTGTAARNLRGKIFFNAEIYSL
jgi:hypothetical protein